MEENNENKNINNPKKQKDKEEIAKAPQNKKSISDNKNDIAIVRISGQVKVSKDIEDTLYRLKLRRKYACVVVKPTKDVLGMLKKVRFYVAYGPINKETNDKLIKQRGRKDKDGKLKPFFRLHPPRKGIKSKLQYPKGVLGSNKADINKLIERML